MIWHLAAVWETIAQAIPEQVALINADSKRSWSEFENRSARLAGALKGSGIGPDAKVAVYALNSNEYLEAHFATFKVRGVPVNVNYRYGEEELVYLFDNADAEAVIYHRRFSPQIAAIAPRLPKLRTLIEIDDGLGEGVAGALDCEELIAGHSPLAPQDYSKDDIYMLYTGGTTGMPKGVMYAQPDVTRGLMIGYDLKGEAQPQTKDELVAAVKRRADAGTLPISLAACPLMHGTGLWGGAILALNMGGAAVTITNTHFDADELWRTVERDRVCDMAIVGDAFARPMLDSLRKAQATGKPYDVSSLKQIFSSGVMFSSDTKRGLLEFADMVIIDSVGATEGGMAASVVTRASPPGETAVFKMNATTKVFKEDGTEVKPGSGEIGMIANGGLAPIGYYKDTKKSATLFREIDGHRYSFPGDYAQVAADGTLILLGRGSSCINTGGEKVFPEEVEEILKEHPDVADCLVIGTPDERLGQRVAAVLSAASGRAIDQDALIGFARRKLASYKLPRAIVIAETIERSASGKPDYNWARSLVAQTAQTAKSAENAS